MATKLTVEFAGKLYSLKADEPPEIVNEVENRIKKILEDYEKLTEEFTLDEVLFAALANVVLQQIETESKMKEIVQKLKGWSYEDRAL
ncbi:MAG: hypothetical protein J7L34_00690 [Thermotogaceae bacterium]|nr:hypothetical protein [Thermotogaceae bacterium]